MLKSKVTLVLLLLTAVLRVSAVPQETYIYEVASDRFDVAWLSTENFTDEHWRDNWAFEGDSKLNIEHGWLCVGKEQDSRKNVFTGWLRKELPKNVLIRMQAKTREVGPQNACNLNLFLHARESDGGTLKFQRSGDYPEYHKIPNYIVTFTGGIQPGWSRVRLNPGFNLLSDKPESRSEPGRIYELVVALHEDQLRFYINGEKVHDVSGFEPLPGGYFGLRTWNSYVAWRAIEIGRILDVRDAE